MTVDIEMLTSGSCEWGYGEREITPNLADGYAMAGHAVTGKVANSIDTPLLVKSLLLNPSSADGIVICFMDLLTGSQALLGRVHQLLPSMRGKIALVGTHTHYGPGNYFGNRFYDAFAQTKHGNRHHRTTSFSLVNHLAQGIVGSIQDAKASAQNGRIAVVRSKLWGSGANRSFPAFLQNGESRVWNSASMPGADPNAGLDPLQKAIDPRVTTILAVNDDSTNVCVFSTAACHTTCLGPYVNTKYSADWPGVATEKVADSAPPGVKYNAAFALPAAGDVSSLPIAGLKRGGGPNEGQNQSLKTNRGTEIGTHVAAVVPLALTRMASSASMTPATISMNTIHWDPEIRGQLGPPRIGWPVAAGAEDGHGVRNRFRLAQEGVRRRPGALIRDRNQHPKRLLLTVAQRLMGIFGAFQVAPSHPLSQIRIGSHAFITVPCELTTIAGFRTERGIIAADPNVNSASIFAATNGYMGYITTPEEYHLQHYEGGQTLFGFRSLASLIATHRLLNRSTPPGAAPSSAARAAEPTPIDSDSPEAEEIREKTRIEFEEIDRETESLIKRLEQEPVVEIEFPVTSDELPDELPPELAELDEMAREWVTEYQTEDATRTSEAASATREDLDNRVEVQVSYLTANEYDPEQVVYLRHGDETIESELIADFGDLQEIGKSLRVAVFLVSDSVVSEDELEFVQTPSSQVNR